MLVIVGAVVVIVSVITGYVAHHGNLMVLYQPTEYIIIFGAAIGALVSSAPMSTIKSMIKQITHALSHAEATKEMYMDLLMLLYELTKTAQGNPLALEPHVENPDNSDIFKRYPTVLKNHHAVHFIADTLKVQISTPMNPYDLDDLMDKDIQTAHEEEHRAPALLTKISDSMPGLGIVAAVLGVVITMGKLTEGKEVIGQSVAAALVGTFLGILASYGFMGPLAAKMEANIAEEGKYLEVIKAAMLAFSKSSPPKVCIEFARRSIPPTFRPTFEEVDKATQNIKKAA